MALSTVIEYVTMARRLLQDSEEPYRFVNTDYLDGLNVALQEAKRLRPDIFSASYPDALTTYTVVDTTAVTFPEEYRMALVYYICGHVQLYDDESVQDSRAAAFLQKFSSTFVAGK